MGQVLNQVFGFPLETVDLAILGGAFATSLFTSLMFFLKDNPWKSFGWPRTMGKVTGAKVAEELSYSKNTNQHTTLYKPVISFAYSFKDKDYHSSSFRRFVTATSNREPAEQEIVRYQEGQEVPVYVNPKKPSQAYLELSKTRALLFTFGMGVFMVGFPVMAVMLVVAKNGN